MPPTACPRCAGPSAGALCRSCCDVEATEALLERVAADDLAAHRHRFDAGRTALGSAVLRPW